LSNEGLRTSPAPSDRSACAASSAARSSAIASEVSNACRSSTSNLPASGRGVAFRDLMTTVEKEKQNEKAKRKQREQRNKETKIEERVQISRIYQALVFTLGSMFHRHMPRWHQLY
jgi:hypothetical protein